MTAAVAVCGGNPGAVPVIVTVYVPAGVPGRPPPPLEDEPPQADRKIKPENIKQANRKDQNFFLRDVKPAPNRASPPTGSHIAYRVPPDGRLTEAVVAAVVLTVSVEVPEPLATEAGESAHVGARVAAGVTMQVKATALLKPFTGATVMVEVEDAPAETETGASAEAAIVKSAGAVTTSVTGVVCCKDPKAPATVTL